MHSSWVRRMVVALCVSAVTVGAAAGSASALGSGGAEVRVTIALPVGSVPAFSGTSIGICTPENDCHYEPVTELATDEWGADLAVPQGSYVIGFSANQYSDLRGFQSYVIAENVMLDDGVNAAIVSTPPPVGAIDGTITDSSGAALSEGSVQVTRVSPRGAYPQFELQATANLGFLGGSFTLPGFPEGDYRVTVRPAAAGQGAAIDELATVTPPATTSFARQLPAGGAIHGVVSDPASQPLPNATVYLISRSHWLETGYWADAMTDGSGGFATSDVLPAPDYVAYVALHGFLNDWASPTPALEIDAGDDLDVPLDIYNGARISGHVYDAAGNPVAGAQVELDPVNLDGQGNGAVTDADGAYLIGDEVGIPEGTYTVSTMTASGQPLGSVTDVTVGRGEVRTGVDIAPPPPAGGTLTGVVTDGATGIGGVTVQASRENDPGSFSTSETTGGDGSYVFTGLPDGTYWISVYGSGWVAQSVYGVRVADGAPAVQNFTLEAGAVATGRVTDGTDGIPYAAVSASSPQPPPVFVFGTGVTADADGYFAFDTLPAGTYTFTAYSDGYAPVEQAGVVVSNAAPTSLPDFVLAAPGAIRVTVRDQGGALLDLASVQASGPGGLFGATPEGGGSFLISGLALGTYSVTASAFSPAFGLPTTASGIDVVPGETSEVEIMLDSAGTIQATLATTAGEPYAFGALVACPGAADPRVVFGCGGWQFSQIADGSAQLAGLAPGTYTVAALFLSSTSPPFPVHSASDTVQVAVESGAIVSCDLVATETGDGAASCGAGGGPTGAIEVTVTDDVGAAVPGASVALGIGPALGTTGADGTLTIDGVALGTYTVVVSAPGHQTAVVTDVEVTDSGLTPVPVVLPRTWAISGTVTGPRDALTAVVACPGGVDPDPAWLGPPAVPCPQAQYLLTSPDGTFNIAGLVTGTYRVRAYTGPAIGTLTAISSVAPVEVSAADVTGLALVLEPTGVDGNGDGIDDAQQPQVTTLPAGVGGGSITIDALDDTYSLAGVSTGPVPAGAPVGSFPVGQISYTVVLPPGAQGSAVDVEITLPAGTNPTAFFKYQGGVWSDFTANTAIAGDTVTLHLVDGGAGDADGEENGVIVDPIVPATGGYSFEGFRTPIDNGKLNSAKAGQAIPVKWRITDANGVPVSDPASFVGITSKGGPCGGADIDEIEAYAPGSSGLQYKGDGEWQLNWKSDKAFKGQCRTLKLQLADGRAGRTADFQFK